MPGGRLTHAERRRIAVCLREGLGYAEIGRLLGRPTSTISREVARSGTPGDYRAADAQQAADDRARRRRPPRSAAAAHREGPAGTRAFVDRFAGVLAGTGLPRMTARVFGCLLTADAAGLTAADLVHRLRVSPASVSKSIAALEAMDLVVRRPDPGSRRERYTMDEDVWRRAWRTDTGAHGEVAAAARQGVELFGADTPAGARFDTMARFFTRLSTLMSGSAITDHAEPDARTVLAALTHAGRPLTAPGLATALGWPATRVTAALATIRRQPSIADPLALRRHANRTYTLTLRPDRLTPTQRAALDRVSGVPSAGSR